MNVVMPPVEALVEALRDVWDEPVLFAADVVDNAYTPGAWDDIATALIQALDAKGFAIVRHRLGGSYAAPALAQEDVIAIPAVIPPAADDGRPRS